MRITAEEKTRRRELILETSFRLFAKKNIDTVTFDEIAVETGLGKRSLHRYFKSKDDLVVSVAVWAWSGFLAGNRRRRPKSGSTAAESYAFFLDSFLTLYRKRADLLRFNQFFNVYIKARRVDAEQMQPYSGMIDAIRERFHAVYLRGQEDGTLRTDAPEEKMFSATLHLMLAAVTRYAVGLVYQGTSAPEDELLFLRELLLDRFTTEAA